MTIEDTTLASDSVVYANWETCFSMAGLRAQGPTHSRPTMALQKSCCRRNSAFNLDAQTGNGGIKSDFAIPAGADVEYSDRISRVKSPSKPDHPGRERRHRSAETTVEESYRGAGDQAKPPVGSCPLSSCRDRYLKNEERVSVHQGLTLGGTICFPPFSAQVRRGRRLIS